MPERPTQIVAECHADTALVRFFIPNARHSIHAQGCPEVAITMSSALADEYFLVGVVDNDDDLNLRCKGFFSAFELVEDQHQVLLRKHPQRQQFIIVLDKAIESFILWNAAQVGIDVGEYGFPDNPKKLGRRYFKSPTIETDPNYLRLLTDLHAKQAPGFITLQHLLNELVPRT
jgi:hypothetical protein